MNFTLHQLRIFLEVARFESVTKAASEMYMTQPAATHNKRTKSLDELIGIHIGKLETQIRDNFKKELRFDILESKNQKRPSCMMAFSFQLCGK